MSILPTTGMFLHALEDRIKAGKLGENYLSDLFQRLEDRILAPGDSNDGIPYITHLESAGPECKKSSCFIQHFILTVVFCLRRIP
jgi:hypothetical protein